MMASNKIHNLNACNIKHDTKGIFDDALREYADAAHLNTKFVDKEAVKRHVEIHFDHAAK
jgi:hypothetical protein